MSEEWRPIADFPGYEISSLGRVASLKRRTRRLLSLQAHASGYLRVAFNVSQHYRPKRSVHSLVAEAWHGPRPAGHHVRHLNGDKRDNTPANLEWGTPRENVQDAFRHGTFHSQKRHACPEGHPYDRQNTYLRPRDNARCCRQCKRVQNRAYKARRAFRAAGVRGVAA